MDAQVSGTTPVLQTWGATNSISTDKHTKGVTLENIFKKYFIYNALQKHKGRTHRFLTMCVLVVTI